MKFFKILSAFIASVFLNLFKVFLSLLRFSSFKIDGGLVEVFEKKTKGAHASLQNDLFKNSYENSSTLRFLLWSLYRRVDIEYIDLFLNKNKNSSFFPLRDLDNTVISSDKQLVNNFQKILENRSVFGSTKQSFARLKNTQKYDPLFLHNRTSGDFLTNNARLNLNFDGLEGFKNYLSLIDLAAPTREKIPFKPNRELTRREKLLRREDSFKTNKKFKKKKIQDDVWLNITTNSTRISPVSLQKTKDTLAQVNFLLKHKRSILRKEIKVENLNLSREVKAVLFSYSNSVGPYGADTTIYSSDLYSKNFLSSIRRINLITEDSSVKDVNSLKKKVGFFNFNVNSDEEWSNTTDFPIGGGFTGYSFSINPILVFCFFFYSIFEFVVLFYIMSFVFGNPYDTLCFFFKYPLVYFYENLASFPSPNYFFFSLSFWFIVFIFFSSHILELLDEERYIVPRVSWVIYFIKDFILEFIFIWFIIFCSIELVLFFDLLVTRIFFVGTPGYPQFFTSFFLIFYEIFYMLGTSGYFSLYLENFLHFDIKFPVFYFSDQIPLVQRYPLVQPGHLFNPFYNRPNLFLWLFDQVVNFFSGEYSRSFFFSNDLRFLYQRELIQDIRKYNYIRKHHNDLQMVGQLYLRGWNGFNYRLDLKIISQPILPTDSISRFDWRFKSSHFDGLTSRLFKPDLFGSVPSKGAPSSQSLHILRNRYQVTSPRYGFLEYSTAPKDSSLWLSFSEQHKSRKKVKHGLHKRSRFLSNLTEFDRRYHRVLFKKSSSVKWRVRDRFNFTFSPADYKFLKMKELNQIIPTKARRNFRNSRIFLNFWSYFPGNSKPRLSFRYRSFIPLDYFKKISSLTYLNDRWKLNESYFYKKKRLQAQNVPEHKMDFTALRGLYLKQPDFLFPNSYLNEKKLIYNENYFKTLSNFDNIQKSTERNFLRNTINSKYNSDRYSPYKNDKTAKMDFGQSLKKPKQNLYKHKMRPNLKQQTIYFNANFLPKFPFKNGKKHHSIAWFLSNFKPFYMLRPTATFTVFSKVNVNATESSFSYKFFNLNIPSDIFSGVKYPFGLFFVGFNKMPNNLFKIVGFDHYYAQNYNFFYSFLDTFFKKTQFVTIPTNVARFSDFTNGGLSGSLDFMYPMLSELRIKEKLIPLNFSYDNIIQLNLNVLQFDPYANIRRAPYSRGSCYFLDSRVQNWFNFYNVIWNEYYHFFFKRSYKTEGNGSKFCLASFNPINGPVSYKLFIDTPTLGIPHIGQYFYSNIPWLQYKFKWLLHPTSTYKRFDSFRYVHQHADKKFYFSSLLKFYQINLFRWQQAANIYNYNQAYSRNFLMHLFFHKYKVIADIFNMKNLFYKLSDSLNDAVENKILINFKIHEFNKSFFVKMPRFYFRKDKITDKRDSVTVFFPSFTVTDFRFFQYIIDFRRWKSLQTNYIRDWKFENYMRYLGPILYKQDIPSLMGFFAPFEFRNQIFVSKMRNDALRFSVFFPKKIIEESNEFLTNPRFPRKLYKPRNFKSSSYPSYYAFVLNKPLIANGSNYSYFLNRQKRYRNRLFFSGLYSHFDRLNFNARLNLNFGQGFVESLSSRISSTLNDLFFGFNFFFDANSKKNRLMRDKFFWLQKTYELREVGLGARVKLFKQPFKYQTSQYSLNKVIPQLGKSLDTNIILNPPKIDFTFFRKFLISEQKSFNSGLNSSTDNVVSMKLPEVFFSVDPSIYLRFGGPKALSKNWFAGQSWLKFVVASQNVSVASFGPFDGYGKDDDGGEYSLNRPDINEKSSIPYSFEYFLPFSIQSITSTLPLKKSFISPEITGLSNGRTFSHNFELADQKGFFNFGLSGIGRLPRLSRSFFHVLFSRNKLDDLKKFKIQYLKIFLMSVPLFHNSEFAANASFKLFWMHLFSQKYSHNITNLKYDFFFNFFSAFQRFPEYATFFHLSDIGTSVDIFSLNDFNLLLYNQYSVIKAFKKFQFFSQLSRIKILNYTELISENLIALKHNYLNEKYLENNNQYSKYFYLILYFFDFNNFLSNFFVSFFFVNVFIDKMIIFFNFFSIPSLKLFFAKENAFMSLADNKLFYNDSSRIHSGFSSKFQFFRLFDFFSMTDYSSFFGYNKLTLNDFFRLRLYYGSFRSHIHWYLYPVHYFFIFKNSLENVFNVVFFDFVAYRLSFFFKYNSLLDSFFLLRSFKDHLFVSKVYSNFERLNSNFFFSNTVFKNGSISLILDSNSIFFNSFYSLYSIFFSFSSLNSTIVRLNSGFSNRSFLNSIFLFRNYMDNLTQFLNYYNIFFFNVKFLIPLHQFSLLNFKYSLNAKYFVTNSENFFNLIFKKSYSLDGSGRHLRPRGFALSLNNVFTYREFDKYRKEHHRQRFRGVTPYWIQNSLKNRFNFLEYYSSPERRYKQLLTRNFMAANAVSSLNKGRLLPPHRGRISSLNYLTDPLILKDVLSNNSSATTKFSKRLNRFSFLFKNQIERFNDVQNSKWALKNNFFVKFFDTKAGLNQIEIDNLELDSQSLNPGYQSGLNEKLLSQEKKQESVDEEDDDESSLSYAFTVTPETFVVNHSTDFASQFDVQDIHQTSLKWQTKSSVLNNNKGLELRTMDKNDVLTKKRLSAIKHFSTNYSFSPDLDFFSVPSYESSQSSSILSNKRIPFFFSKMFPANPSSFLYLDGTLKESGDEDVDIGDRYFSGWKLGFVQKRGLHDKKIRGFFQSPFGVHNEFENLRLTKPRFFKSKLHRSFLDSTKSSIGSPVNTGRRALYKNSPYFSSGDRSSKYFKSKKVRDPFSLKKQSRFWKTYHQEWFLPNNVRRFVRPYNKVLMYMPYIYSKWYTQNPRLNFSVNTELLDIFLTNSYDEFNFICVQSLMLLKRKIMYNIINLKLVGKKQKMLYYFQFDNLLVRNDSSPLLNFSNNFFLPILRVLIYLSNIFKSLLQFNFSVLLNSLYDYYIHSLLIFFDNSAYLHLLSNNEIKKYKHDDKNVSDNLFVDFFFYNYATKRLLSQISVSNSTIGGWNNPLGISGQYIPGLNFYMKHSFFNFDYQYKDFFSGRSFAPESLLYNNILRQNNQFLGNEVFFGEFPINFNYRPSWHFLSFRIFSPVSPFIEYDLPNSLNFSNPVKQRHWRLPLNSLRRVTDFYPNHLSSFFSIFATEGNTFVGHDLALPMRLKSFSYILRKDPIYRRKVENLFAQQGLKLFSHLELFPLSLKLRQLTVLSDINKLLNFSPVVNKKRLTLRLSAWSPIRFNFYYLFNWKTYLHKNITDNVGFRSYKLNPFFDIYQGAVPSTLKRKALQHIVVSQIPRIELDSRRRVVTGLSLKEFSSLIYYFFNYVNQNFQDAGYFNSEQKILRYVNRKIYPYMPQSFHKNIKSNFVRRLGLKSKDQLPKIDLSFFLPRTKKRKNSLAVSILPLKPRMLLNLGRTNARINEFVFQLPVPTQESLFLKQMSSLSFNKNRYFYNTQIVVFRSFSSGVLQLPRIVIQSSAFKGFLLQSLNLKKFMNNLMYYFGNKSSYRFFELKNFVTKTANTKAFNYLTIPFPLNTEGPSSFLNMFRHWYFSLMEPNFFHVNSNELDYWVWQWLYLAFQPYRTVSRISGINQLFLMKRFKERGLNPNSWISFDIFSRIRPSFKPFLSKFGKTFMLSKVIPSKGFPSYNYFVSTQTRFDNFFERHPYLSFGVGLFRRNSLLFSEGSYKEIRKRSHMLDLSKRFAFSNSPASSLNPRYKSELMHYIPKYKNKRFNKNVVFKAMPFAHISALGSGIIPFFGKAVLFEDNETSFTSNKVFRHALKNPITAFNLDSIEKFEGSEGDVRNNLKGLARYPSLRSKSSLRKKFGRQFNNFYKNSVINSVVNNPRYHGLLFNTFLMRPYTNYLSFFRVDGNFFSSLKKTFKFFYSLDDLFNLSRNFKVRSYYQPNLKLFFDFNAYKQRYNLSLIFRELSFDQDFQLFLFKKKSSISFLADFTFFNTVDYYFFFGSTELKKIQTYFYDTKFKIFYSVLSKFYYKCDFSYFVLIFINSILLFLSSFFYFLKFSQFFDFSFFINLFNWTENSFIYYFPKRSLFQLFFHISIFKEYFKFSWLFSLKFLIFTFDYYPYYFLIFTFCLIARAVSLRLKRMQHNSPFVVPYYQKFTDLKANGYSGWFEEAWDEVRAEALERLNQISHTNDVTLSFAKAISPRDLELIKKKYGIADIQQLNDYKDNPINDDKIQQYNLSSVYARNPLAFLKLKGRFSKLGFLSFLQPTTQEVVSDRFQAENVINNVSENVKVDIPEMGGFPVEKENTVRKFPKLKGFSLKIFFRMLFLFFKRKITFGDFLRVFPFGGSSSSDNFTYTVDDFNNDFGNLFSNTDSTFMSVAKENFKAKRMIPEDENIHFYRKPGSFNDIFSDRFRGTEADQFHYILEFPGRFNNSNINSFSSFYTLKNLNFRQPQMGFFSFSKNAILPTTFEEFLVFCSINPNFIEQKTTHPFFSNQLEQYRNLWSLFQYVTRYDYNMYSYYNTDDVRFAESKINRNPLEDQTTLFENFKFWVNKASNDALDFNIFNPYFYFPYLYNTRVPEAVTHYEYLRFLRGDKVLNTSGTKNIESSGFSTSPYDEIGLFLSSEPPGRFNQFSFSILYFAYIYLILFFFFLFLVFFFCSCFLFLFSFYNYCVFFF